MNEITLVTAFFNVGRENFKAIPRSDNTYLNNFEFWARMRNKLIVYTDSAHADEILKIRKDFGLAEKTRIVILNDIFSLCPEIYIKMKEVSSNQFFVDFRYLPNATSNIAEYSYLMYLKAWFLKDAVEKKYAEGMVAWIDFGFNHGGDLYTDPTEFDFEWKYDFSEKIHFFYFGDYDSKPIFEIVRRLCDCFMGCLIVLSDSLCSTLFDLYTKSLNALLLVDLIDDDQLLMMMSYRQNPDIFEIEQSAWFLPLKEHGADHLSVRERKKSGVIKSKVKSLLAESKRRKLIKRYISVTRRNLKRDI